MSCFNRIASFSAPSHFFRHSSCCATNLMNSRKTTTTEDRHETSVPRTICVRRSHKSYLLQFLRQGRKSSERYRQWLPQEKTQTWLILSCTRKAQRFDKRNKLSLIKKETTSQLRHLRSFFPSSFKQSLAPNQNAYFILLT